jgi:hypothetical protein
MSSTHPARLRRRSVFIRMPDTVDPLSVDGQLVKTAYFQRA